MTNLFLNIFLTLLAQNCLLALSYPNIVNFTQVLKRAFSANLLRLFMLLIAINLFISNRHWHLIHLSCIVGTICDFQHFVKIGING